MAVQFEGDDAPGLCTPINRTDLGVTTCFDAGNDVNLRIIGVPWIERVQKQGTYNGEKKCVHNSEANRHNDD